MSNILKTADRRVKLIKLGTWCLTKSRMFLHDTQTDITHIQYAVYLGSLDDQLSNYLKLLHTLKLFY